MSDFEITSLPVQSFNNIPLPNRFFRQANPAAGLALVLPGLNYSADMPLLYYPTKLLVERGLDVLQVCADYTRPEFQSLSRPEQMRWLGADAQAALQVGRNQGGYRRLILLGKSIGSLTLAYLLGLEGLAQAAAIWLTPLLHQPWLVQAAMQHPGPALFVAGAGDRTYDPAAMQSIRQARQVEVLLLPDANHSLEIPGDITRSLQYMMQVLQAIADFL